MSFKKFKFILSSIIFLNETLFAHTWHWFNHLLRDKIGENFFSFFRILLSGNDQSDIEKLKIDQSKL